MDDNLLKKLFIKFIEIVFNDRDGYEGGREGIAEQESSTMPFDQPNNSSSSSGDYNHHYTRLAGGNSDIPVD